MQLPVVNHPDYVAKINDDNKFPIKKFGALANHLIENKVVKKFYICLLLIFYYQLAFVTPGINPLLAISLNITLEIPNCLI